ncbi:Stk1 family PASTA domain-containing Ser/Thr kinase [Microbacterium sp. GXS0129]|uniref:Stk1 family PASTA domain-containing Ser/Thr kinase n=1 Tax=Microbacterium sp. GXS0129 TaxID=3377836 RepID=UPI00383ADAA2
MTSHQTADPLIGRLVDGRYRVRARIARGGMATVYVATDLRLERRIALKVMHSHLSDDSVFQSRFIQEARAAARLADPNVVNVFDQGQDGELAYLVMEYLPGITLRELLKEQRRLSISQAVTIMDGVLSGLAAAHRAGIVHRDVKPENVLLAEDGRIKIGDFGLARATTANTATGQQLMGTIAYLAPELVTRGTADARSDIYALGIMLYEMLVGEQPFRGEQPMQIAFQHATESVPRPSVRNPGVPEQLDELVLWSTERAPDDRPLDAQVMLDRLREIERELGITPVITRSEPSFTAGLAIPEDLSSSGGLTAVLPRDSAPVMPLPATDSLAPVDNSARLRTVTRRDRRKGGWLLLIVILVAALAGGIGWYFGSGPGSQVVIADVAGLNEQDAMAKLGEQDIVVTTAQAPSLTVPAGSAIGTDPAGGEHVDKGTSVQLIISSGPAPTTIEDLSGVDEATAREILGNKNITVSTATYQFTDDPPAGRLMNLTVVPASGDPYDCLTGCDAFEGDTATLLVSKGPVPPVAGMTVDAATKALTDAGLKVNTDQVKIFTDEQQSGIVVGIMDRDGGGNWQPDETVTLIVSAGLVPDVSGLSVAKATEILGGAGLQVASATVEEFSSDIAKGNVIRIADREDGGSWRVNDTVTLVTSKGPELFEIPDVSGLTRDQAAQELRDRGFNPVYNGLLNLLPDSSTEAVGTTPGAGEMRPKGTDVTITIRTVL